MGVPYPNGTQDMTEEDEQWLLEDLTHCEICLLEDCKCAPHA